MVRARVTVADYINQQLALCGKSQKQVAEEAGFDKPNIISMLKTGSTKLPVSRVGPMAKALGVDPVHLLRLVLSEYLPETFEAIEGLIGQSLVSQGELKIVEIMRKAAGGTPLEGLSDKHMKELTDVVRRIAAEELKDRGAAVRASRRIR
jgi:hypothetical protein